MSASTPGDTTPADAPRAFDRLCLLYGTQALEKLRRARVIIFGVGGVGSWCAEALARCAAGTITLVDSDCVEPTNINRQLPALTSTLGRPKVDVMAARIRDINPACTVTAINARYTAATAADFDLDSYDIVIDAIDSLADKADLIVRTTSLTRPRLFSAMGAARKTDATQFALAEFRQVKGCPLARALRQRFKRSGIFPRRKFRCVYSPQNISTPDQAPRRPNTPNGSAIFATATAGLILAQAAVEHLISSAQ